MIVFILAGLTYLAGTGEIAPKVTSATPSVQQVPGQPASEEIVVRALPDIQTKDSAVTAQTLGSVRTGNAVKSRYKFELAQRWARCAAKAATLGQRGWLRSAIDLRTSSAEQQFAMHRLLQLNASCVPSPRRALESKPDAPGYVVDPYYDRGALVIEVLKTFVPLLKLTKADMRDGGVQARFDAREIPLSKFRLPADQQYFEMALCLVRVQPELSVRLAMIDKPLDTVRRLEAAIVNRGKVCVGNARHVYFDGIQFRFYIADAVYRWAVAAQRVETLIPPV